MLEIKNLYVSVEGNEILKGISLEVKPGEIHAIMGPNGSGKSTLANVLAGKEEYEITQGEVNYLGEDLLDMAPEDRARKGLFLSFQYPVEIPGVPMVNFLKTALNEHRKSRGQKELTAGEFLKFMREKMEMVDMHAQLTNRSVNEGFSGGEKKKSEILQLLTLQPKLAILDETDSGLDVDAVRVVTKGILSYKNEDNSLLIISHSPRLLEGLPVDYVHILSNGKFVSIGSRDLIDEINTDGFARFIQAETMQA